MRRQWAIILISRVGVQQILKGATHAILSQFTALELLHLYYCLSEEGNLVLILSEGGGLLLLAENEKISISKGKTYSKTGFNNRVQIYIFILRGQNQCKAANCTNK